MRYSLIFSAIICVFVGLRLLNINVSLEFFNDIGRDFLVLYDWQHYGKPPLLGPQTSVLPFNQSAWYFYLLYPFYLIFDGNLLSTIYAGIVFYLATLTVVFFLVRRSHPNLTVAFLMFAFLLTIHPQVIIQTRFLWNPSLLPPLLSLAAFGMLFLLRRWSFKTVLVVGLSLSLAVSLNYSAAPALIAFWLTAIVFWKQKSLALIAATIAGLAWWNLPTLFFELRHQFLLTKLMLVRPALPQHRVDLLTKISDLSRYLIDLNANPVPFIVFMIFATALFLPSIRKKLSRNLKMGLCLFLVTFVLTVLSPFDIQSHYIFPILTLGLLFLSLLPIRTSLIIAAILAVVWLRPSQLQTYFHPAIRTIDQLENCAQLVCDNEKEPFFVSLQAGFYGFHAGPEYRYIFKRHGCQVKIIETEPNTATLMATVIDNSDYEHGQTAYNELTLFGKSNVKTVYQCEGNIKVYMLSKESYTK